MTQIALPSTISPTLPLTSRRARLARALDTLGLLDRLLWLRAKIHPPVLTVLSYHRIADSFRVGELDRDVVEADPEGFKAHLDVIRAYANIVSLDDVRRFRKGSPLPPNPAMLAFDDGYSDMHDVVLPILKKEGLSGTFFIPTAYPDSGKLFWWDRISLTLKRCKLHEIEVTYPHKIRLEPAKDPEAAAKKLFRVIKRTPRVDLVPFFEELEKATGVAISPDEERALAAQSIMSWQQVKAMHAAGMSIQSHSHSHRVLDTLTPDEALADLKTSRSILSEVTGADVRTIAYPVGYEVMGPYRAAAVEAGYDLAFTYNSGPCLSQAYDPLNFPRLAVERGHAGALYKLLLLLGQRRDRVSLP